MGFNMRYLIEKTRDLHVGKKIFYIILIGVFLLHLYVLYEYQPEVVLLEEEFYSDDTVSEIIEQNIPEEIVQLTPEEYINSLISTINRKCSSSMITDSRAIYYIKWDDIDTLWKQVPEEIKKELNSLSSKIEGYWQLKGYRYTVEVVLDSENQDKVLAVSTNGRITFSTH